MSLSATLATGDKTELCDPGSADQHGEQAPEDERQKDCQPDRHLVMDPEEIELRVVLVLTHEYDNGEQHHQPDCHSDPR